MDDEEDILNVDFDPTDLENVDEELLLGGITPPSLNVTKIPVDLEKSTESVLAPENSSLAISQEDPGSAKTATKSNETTPELSKSGSTQATDDPQNDSQRDKTSDDSEDDDEDKPKRQEDRLKFKTEQTNLEQKRFFTRTGIPDSLDDVKLPELKKFADNRFNRGRLGQNFKQRATAPKKQHHFRDIRPHQSRDSNLQPPRDTPILQKHVTMNLRHHSSQFVGLRAKGVGTVLLNPHFKGSVKADPNVRLAWDIKTAALIESRDLLKATPPTIPLIGGLLVSSSPLAISPQNLTLLPSLPPPPIPLLPALGGFKGQRPPPPPQPMGARQPPPVGGTSSVLRPFPAQIPTGQPPPLTLQQQQQHVIARQSLMATSVARMGPPTLFSSVPNPSPPSVLHPGPPKSIFDPSKPPPLIGGPRHATSPANDVILNRKTDKNDWLGLTEDFLRKIQTKKVSLDIQDRRGQPGPGPGPIFGAPWGRGRSGSSSRYSSSGGSSASGSRKQQAAEHIRRKYRISSTGSISKLGWNAQVQHELQQALGGNEPNSLYDEDYLRKLEEQKRLREELNRRKEMRRQQEIAKKHEKIALKRSLSKNSEESFNGENVSSTAEKKEPQKLQAGQPVTTKVSPISATPAKKIIRLNSGGSGGSVRKVILPSTAATKTIFQRTKKQEEI